MTSKSALEVRLHIDTETKVFLRVINTEQAEIIFAGRPEISVRELIEKGVLAEPLEIYTEGWISSHVLVEDPSRYLMLSNTRGVMSPKDLIVKKDHYRI